MPYTVERKTEPTMEAALFELVADGKPYAFLVPHVEDDVLVVELSTNFEDPKSLRGLLIAALHNLPEDE